ncbi:hypothetical protein CEUSTIGMA_g2221.t1 [Chlamydomonas eustigma]|uniref:Nucleotide-diphospho-sugar transferase domain-containing protein n=1 Tax=Chlamydomonas eustigma TaxID=1157962 RepID=A0A250WVA6_9CHLO|nr:hypothetical protein CEUSTIGMA_g2221.t1 [Chlamydomonas eustigma]|eukprot:GAX74774.1 hypothetical protein CEUSTIGMA_g2221.t1 [Chlamydomonas eustigma]
MSAETGCDLQALMTILVITSPSPSNPSTFLIRNCLQSIYACIKGLTPRTPVIVVMDGYNVAPEARLKRGRITADMVQMYEDYKSAVSTMCADMNLQDFRIEKLPTHHGFALGVKRGLELCTTKHCMICQHDRIFRKAFDQLPNLLMLMDSNTDIRYVGFPTITSSTHRSQIQNRYQLSHLNTLSISLGASYQLQPCIFWFDSQHLCLVERYLEIYQPKVFIPKEMMTYLGWNFVSNMKLKKGDFIEDRFGQMQRKCFIEMRARNAEIPELERAFKWFGSYLVWTRPLDSKDAWHASIAQIKSEGAAALLPAHIESDESETCGVSHSEVTILKYKESEAHIIGVIREYPSQGFERGLETPGLACYEESGKIDEVSISLEQHHEFSAQVFVSHLRGRTLDFIDRTPMPSLT